MGGPEWRGEQRQGRRKDNIHPIKVKKMVFLACKNLPKASLIHLLETVSYIKCNGVF